MEIFLIIILLVRFNSKSILLSNINNLLYFNISLGNPSQNINLLVDINSDKTIILGNQDNYKNIPNSFKFNDSSSFNSSCLMEKNYPDNFIINYFAEGLISSDFLKINDNFTRPLSFIHSHVISFKSAIYGILSLINMNKTLNDNDIKFSFIDTLASGNNINSRTFSLKFNSSNTWINIGEIAPIENTTNCKMQYNNKFRNFFNCRLDRFRFNNYSYIYINKKIIFSSTIDSIYFPETFLQDILNKYINKYFFNQCNKTEYPYPFKIKCNKNFNYTGIPNIFLEIDNVGYEIPFNYLFYCPDNGFYCFIKMNFYSNDFSLEDTVVIGISLLKNYEIFFDLEKEKISFIGGNKIMFSKDYTKLIIQISLLSILVIIILFFIIYRFTKAKRDNSKLINLKSFDISEKNEF